MKSIEQLRAELTTAQAAHAVTLNEKLEARHLTRKLNLLQNPALGIARVGITITQQTTDKLKEIEQQCIMIIAEMPTFNKKTGENRKWNPTRQFGLGNHIQAVSGILAGIQYSVAEHKLQMLALTGLSEDLIEDTLNAFGSLPYYNANYNVIVDEVPLDLPRLTQNLLLISEILDVELNMQLLTPQSIELRSQKAMIRETAHMTAAALAQRNVGQLIEIK